MDVRTALEIQKIRLLNPCSSTISYVRSLCNLANVTWRFGVVEHVKLVQIRRDVWFPTEFGCKSSCLMVWVNELGGRNGSCGDLFLLL